MARRWRTGVPWKRARGRRAGRTFRGCAPAPSPSVARALGRTEGAPTSPGAAGAPSAARSADEQGREARRGGGGRGRGAAGRGARPRGGARLTARGAFPQFLGRWFTAAFASNSSWFREKKATMVMCTSVVARAPGEDGALNLTTTLLRCDAGPARRLGRPGLHADPEVCPQERPV